MSTLSESKIHAPGKWILVGEHSVLRGFPALVFPLEQRALDLVVKETQSSELSLELLGDYGPEFKILFWSLVDRACSIAGVNRTQLRGHLQLSSQIPVGSGLGASAALCVAMGKWFLSQNLIKQEDVYEFSRNLENLFHGESSGVDIAVALGNKPLRFLRNGERKILEISWKPKCFLSYSGQKGSTLECVQRVKKIMENNPDKGKQLDLQMASSVAKAEKALLSSKEVGLSELKESFELARSCFDQWGLSVIEPMKYLESRGAIAVKPTGSGGGGYILSLWKEDPPQDLLSQMISCF